MTIGAWLSDATDQLVRAEIASARLDAEIILSHSLKQPRTYVHAHPADQIDPRLEEIANARLDLRLDHVPIAYIVGHKEFYGRLFYTTPAVLIPRPESEDMLALLAEALGNTESLPGMPTKRLVDIGTGSGCLGISAKLTYPELDVTLLDTSKSALALAEKNATVLQADVHIQQSNLLRDYSFTPDIVLANLPYVDENWERSPETAHEPREALFATKHGLALIEKCLSELAARMKPGGIAIFEADPRQWPDIRLLAARSGFQAGPSTRFAQLFTKSL